MDRRRCPRVPQIQSKLRPRSRVDATVRASSWSLLQVQCSDELVPHIGMRTDGQRVCALSHLPRKSQPVKALLVGINGELRVPIGADVEVELEVVVICRVVLALQR